MVFNKNYKKDKNKGLKYIFIEFSLHKVAQSVVFNIHILFLTLICVKNKNQTIGCLYSTVTLQYITCTVHSCWI